MSIDPGRKSGWAIFDGSLYKRSGIAKTAAARAEVIRMFMALSKDSSRRVAVVETWGPNWKSYTALARTAENRGRWLEHLALVDVPVVDVRPEKWRSRLYGRGYSNLNKTTTKVYKKLAVAHVKARLKLEVTHDQAEAILIGIWAAFASEVAEAMYPELDSSQIKKKMKQALQRLK